MESIDSRIDSQRDYLYLDSSMIARPIIVLATLVALVFGSLGLPTFLHSCRTMKLEQAPGSHCVACEKTETEKPACCAEEHKNSGPSITQAVCCTSVMTVAHLDPGQLPKIEIAAPLLLGSATFSTSLHLCSPISSIPAGYQNDLPPPILRHSQSSYLFNSTFLI